MGRNRSPGTCCGKKPYFGNEFWHETVLRRRILVRNRTPGTCLVRNLQSVNEVWYENVLRQRVWYKTVFQAQRLVRNDTSGTCFRTKRYFVRRTFILRNRTPGTYFDTKPTSRRHVLVLNLQECNVVRNRTPWTCSGSKLYFGNEVWYEIMLRQRTACDFVLKHVHCVRFRIKIRPWSTISYQNTSPEHDFAVKFLAER